MIPIFAVSVSAEWTLEDRGWIKLYYHRSDAANVKNIIEAVLSGRETLKSTLGLDFQGEFYIFLASKSAEFGELTGWRLPEWTQGVAVPQQRRVVLKSPKFSGTGFDLSKAAVHEFVHIVIAEEVGDVPLWFNEGLAVFLSGEGYFDQKTLDQAALGRKILAFEEMESVLRFDPLKAQLAYSQSLSAVQYLVVEFGPDVLRRIFNGLKSGEKFDRSFFQATGLWPDEFETEWGGKVQSDYRFAFLKDLTHYLSFVFGPLAVIGGFFLWYRKRRIVKRWEREEKHSDFSDDYGDYDY